MGGKIHDAEVIQNSAETGSLRSGAAGTNNLGVAAVGRVVGHWWQGYCMGTWQDSPYATRVEAALESSGRVAEADGDCSVLTVQDGFGASCT